MYLLLLQHNYITVIFTCLLMDLVNSYRSVYGSVQSIHSEAPVARIPDLSQYTAVHL